MRPLRAAALDPAPEELANRDGRECEAHQRESQVHQIGHGTVLVLPCIIHAAPGPLPPRSRSPGADRPLRPTGSTASLNGRPCATRR